MRHRPEGPGLLPGAPDGTAPLLGQAGIVQQEQAVWRTLGHSGGHALLVLSSDGERDNYLAALRANNLNYQSAAERDFVNERMTVYRVSPC